MRLGRLALDTIDHAVKSLLISSGSTYPLLGKDTLASLTGLLWMLFQKDRCNLISDEALTRASWTTGITWPESVLCADLRSLLKRHSI